MRDFSSLDFDKNYRFVFHYNFHEIMLGRHLIKMEKEGIDITKFENIRDLRFKGKPISFTLYCDTLADLDGIKEDYKNELKLLREKKKLDPSSSSTYKMDSLRLMIKRINNSDNKEQLFYDSLCLPFFRNYIELTLYKINIPFKIKDLKRYKIKDEDKVIYFKTPYELVSIIYSPLTREQKLKMINDTYNSCYTVKNSNFMIKTLLKRRNLINIELEDQNFLLNEWMKRNKIPLTRTLTSFIK